MRDDIERLKQDHAAYVAKLKEGHREELYAMQERLEVFYAFRIHSPATEHTQYQPLKSLLIFPFFGDKSAPKQSIGP